SPAPYKSGDSPFVTELRSWQTGGRVLAPRRPHPPRSTRVARAVTRVRSTSRSGGSFRFSARPHQTCPAAPGWHTNRDLMTETSPIQSGNLNWGTDQPDAGPDQAFAPRETIANGTKLTGAQALIKALEMSGVDVMFGLPGGCIMPAYDALIGS